jgi:hypothetical protein
MAGRCPAIVMAVSTDAIWCRGVYVKFLGRRPLEVTLGNMERDYIRLDDGLEPTDYDWYYDYPAKTDKDLTARVYVKVERDPERAAYLEERQNAAIIALLQWVRDHLAKAEARNE